MWNASAVFDRAVLKQLEGRWEQYGLTDFSEAVWRGFASFGSNASNPWGKKNGSGTYEEYDPTPLPGFNFSAYEPCNYVSNMAYYRSMLAIAQIEDDGHWSFDAATVAALVQSYAALAPGSAFFHAQGSPRGGPGVISDNLDNVPIGLLSFVAHQGSLSGLPHSPILHDLLAPNGTARRVQSGVDSARVFVDVVANASSVYEWFDLLHQRVIPQVPGYTLTFGAMVSSILNLIFSPAIADPIVKLVAGRMLGPADAAFLEGSYVPAFRGATSHVKLSLGDRWHLGMRGAGVLLKMMYAFLWQEEIIKGPWIKDAGLNRLGGEAMPYVNMLGNAMTGYAHPDPTVQSCKNVYPGDAACRVGGSAHTKWHEQAGNALVDLMYLCNDLNALLHQKQADPAASVKWASPTSFYESWKAFWNYMSPLAVFS